MTNRRTTSGAAIALGIVVALLAACSGPAPDPTPATTIATPTTSPTPLLPPSPTPSVDPTTAAAEAAILKAYRGYWDVMVRILANPDPFGQTALFDELQGYAVDKAQANLFSTAYQLQQSGIAVRGEPVIDPTVTDFVAATSATIVDCVDSTNWQPVVAATGASAAAPGQAKRVVTNSTLIYYDNRWVVNSYTPNRDQTC